HRSTKSSFLPLLEDQMFSSFFLEDKESMIRVLRAVDKANGYCFGDLEERNLQAMMSAAVGADFHFNFTLGVQERYVETGGRTVEEEMMDL
uniref:Uncharacterized protein n=1 Tax=Oryzias sinensis TaxID=183150 RepID=A0A8C8DBC5_9TELE